MRLILVLASLLICSTGNAQKKTIDHTVYNDWKKNENQQISADGNFVSYEINPHQGDGFLYLYNVKSAKLDSFPRGKDAKISANSDYMAFKIVPGFDTIRRCELEKIDKKKWPKDTLGIYLFAKDSLIKIPLLKSFSVGEEHNLLAYLQEESTSKENGQAAKTKKKKAKKNKKGGQKEEPKSNGNQFTVLDPLSGKSFQHKGITDYTISRTGKFVALVEHKKTKSDSSQIHLVSTTDLKNIKSLAKKTAIKNMTFNEKETLFACLSSLDTSKTKNYSLGLMDLENLVFTTIADSTTSIFPKGQSVSEFGKLIFTKNDKFLFFGVSDIPQKELKDSLTEAEKVKVDVWHYKENKLQSQQLSELKRDLERSAVYAYNLETKSIVGLSDDTLKVRATKNLKGNFLLASCDEQYALQNQWDSPQKRDYYRVSLLDGKVELLKKSISFSGDLSPSGKYYTYFDESKGQHLLLDIESGKETCMTCEHSKIEWLEDMNGMPMTANPFDFYGFSSSEMEIYLKSKYDIWAYNQGTQKLQCITNLEGEINKIRLELRKWEEDSIYIDLGNCYIQGFNEKSKGFHLFSITHHNDHFDLNEQLQSNHKLVFLARSKNGAGIILRKQSLHAYPELEYLGSNFDQNRVISITNPQQSEYNWADVSLVKWKSYSGKELEGLLYKPENFDPSKKYPLLIYYYELNSDGLHNYYSPKPTASIIYPTEYCSAGYLVFIPDIRYDAGHPAKSAYDCVMSGTDYLLKLVPQIDSTRMGLQGQSWGGYQTAQLITMTNRYRAAMAGAPVANMFSAYGGIRWESGVNRQFQYEKTQSRIGKTIWEAPELYFENSPLFHLPKVNTPLLIMSNDKDGAVPWYQGIELFTGMRRLGKPCWMLNYNGDGHNLMENANRIDLSIRMRQFFDHFLLDAPEPQWMSNGIPAIEKGKELGY